MLLKHLVLSILALFNPPKKTDAEIDAKLIAKRDSDPKYQGLDPINSIVDLLKLFDQDSSIEARADLWRDMGLDGVFTGTAEQNQKLMVEFRRVLADDNRAF